MFSSRRKVFVVDPDNFTPLYDLNLAKALAEDGWGVEWITSSHQFDSMPDTRPIGVKESFFGISKRLPLQHLRPIRRLPSARRILKAFAYPLELALLHLSLREQSPGILHVQWALLPHLDSVFWRRWRGVGWVVVFTCHDPVPLSGSLPRLFFHTNYTLCTAADAVIVHGDVARRILETSGIPTRLIHVIEPGPPTLGSPIEGEEARRTLGLDRAIPVLLFFGYIKPYKGLQTLLESLPIIRAAAGNLILLIAGEMMEPVGRY
jgi:glycosyltransferase involved in cell wall biosynthesis